MKKVTADRWLQEIQRSTQAWSIAWALLEQQVTREALNFISLDVWVVAFLSVGRIKRVCGMYNEKDTSIRDVPTLVGGGGWY